MTIEEKLNDMITKGLDEIDNMPIGSENRSYALEDMKVLLELREKPKDALHKEMELELKKNESKAKAAKEEKQEQSDTRRFIAWTVLNATQLGASVLMTWLALDSDRLGRFVSRLGLDAAKRTPKMIDYK